MHNVLRYDPGLLKPMQKVMFNNYVVVSYVVMLVNICSI